MRLSATTGVVVVVLLYLLRSPTTDALEIDGSPFYTTVYTNGNLIQNRSLPIKCTPSDLGNTNVFIDNNNGVTTLIEVTCGFPLVTYNLATKAWVPRSGVRNDFWVCQTRDQAPTTPYANVTFDPSIMISDNPGFTTPQTSTVSATTKLASNTFSEVDESNPYFVEKRDGMRMVQIRDKRHDLAPPSDMRLSLDHNNVHSRIAGYQTDSCPVMGPTLCIVSFSSTDMKCVMGAVKKMLKPLETSLATLNSSMINWVDQTQILNNENQANFLQLNTTVYKNYDYFLQLQSVVTDIQQSQQTEQSTVMNMSAAMSNYSKQVASNMSDLATQLNNVIQAANLSDSSFQSELGRLTMNTTDRLNQLVMYMNTNLGALGADINLLNQKSFSTSDSLNQLYAAIINLHDNTPMKSAMTRLVMYAMVQQVNAGEYLPFLFNYGTLPDINQNQYATLFIDTSYINYIDASNDMWSIEFEEYCNLQFLALNPTYWVSPDTFMRTMGPTNCTSSTCDCYMVYTLSHCSAAAGVNSTTYFNAQQLNSSMCTGAGLTTSAPTLLSSADSLMALYGSVCANGVSNNIQSYQVISLRMGSAKVMPYSSYACTLDLRQIFMLDSTISYTSTNFIFQHLMNVGPSYIVATTENMQAYFNKQLGIMPNNITTKVYPFQWENSEPATCMVSTFMSYTPDLVPVYLLTNPQITTAVTVTVNGTVYNTYDVTINPPTGYTPPQEAILVGEIGGPSYSSFVYDVGPQDVSLSNVASSQQGRVTYAMTNNQSDFSLQHWGDMFGVPFDHTVADNVAQMHARNVSSSGQCIVGTGEFLGTACTMMQYLKAVVFNTISNEAQFEETTVSYTVNIPIPAGNISLVQFTGCPSYSVVQTTTLATTLALMNPSSNPIYVDLEFTGGCPNIIRGVYIPATSSYNQIVQACNAGNKDLAVNIYQTNGNSFGALCAQGVNVTVNATHIYTVLGIADTNYVNNAAVVVQNTAYNAFLQLQQQTLQSFFVLAQFGLQNVAVTNYFSNQPINNAIFDTVTNTYNTISAHVSQIINNTASLNLVPMNDYVQNQTAQLNALGNEIQLLLNSSVQSLKQIQLDANTYSADAAKSGLQVNITNNATSQFGQAVVGMASTVVGTFVAMANYADSSSSGGFGNIFGVIMGGMASAIENGGKILGKDVLLPIGEAAGKLVNALAKAGVALLGDVTKLFGAVGGMLHDIGTIMTFVLYAGLVGGAAYLGYRWYMMRKNKGTPQEGPAGGHLDPALLNNIKQMNATLHCLHKWMVDLYAAGGQEPPNKCPVPPPEYDPTPIPPPQTQPQEGVPLQGAPMMPIPSVAPQNNYQAYNYNYNPQQPHGYQPQQYPPQQYPPQAYQPQQYPPQAYQYHPQPQPEGVKPPNAPAPATQTTPSAPVPAPAPPPPPPPPLQPPATVGPPVAAPPTQPTKGPKHKPFPLPMFHPIDSDEEDSDGNPEESLLHHRKTRRGRT